MAPRDGSLPCILAFALSVIVIEAADEYLQEVSGPLSRQLFLYHRRALTFAATMLVVYIRINDRIKQRTSSAASLLAMERWSSKEEVSIDGHVVAIFEDSYLNQGQYVIPPVPR